MIELLTKQIQQGNSDPYLLAAENPWAFSVDISDLTTPTKGAHFFTDYFKGTSLEWLEEDTKIIVASFDTMYEWDVGTDLDSNAGWTSTNNVGCDILGMRSLSVNPSRTKALCCDRVTTNNAEFFDLTTDPWSSLRDIDAEVYPYHAEWLDDDVVLIAGATDIVWYEYSTDSEINALSDGLSSGLRDRPYYIVVNAAQDTLWTWEYDDDQLTAYSIDPNDYTANATHDDSLSITSPDLQYAAMSLSPNEDYMAIWGVSDVLQIVDVSDPTAMTAAGTYDFGPDLNNTTALDYEEIHKPIWLNDDYVALARREDILIFDATNKSSITLEGQFWDQFMHDYNTVYQVGELLLKGIVP